MDFNLCDSHTVTEYVLLIIALISEICPFIAKKCGFKSNGILQLIYNVLTSDCCKNHKKLEEEIEITEESSEVLEEDV